MPDIDIDKIKPGDTVRMRVQSYGMQRNEIDPIEFTSKAYRIRESVHVGAYRAENSSQVTILEHIPARPDWADALVVRVDGTSLSNPHLVRRDSRNQVFFIDTEARAWTIAETESMGPITVVLDADGNPPEHEHEWLDADALDKLPPESLTICDDDGSWPLVKDYDGKWQHTGLVATGRLDSSDLARARVLWAPEADR